MYRPEAKLKSSSSLGRLAGKALRLLRRPRDLEPSAKGETVVGAYPQASTKGLVDTHFRSEAYLLSNKRKVEVETEKAMLISFSRHPRWKGAGGPC